MSTHYQSAPQALPQPDEPINPEIEREMAIKASDDFLRKAEQEPKPKTERRIGLAMLF